jgi:hypothetical protein
MALRRRQALAFLENVHEWHRNCDQVTEICGNALHDLSVIGGEIGVTLDKADRMLFALKNATSETNRHLRRQEPALASQLVEASNHVFELRNETARFLIRCQGPDPTGGRQMDEAARRLFYDRAMQEVGFNARMLHAEVSKELEATWNGIQDIIAQAEIVSGGDSQGV